MTPADFPSLFDEAYPEPGLNPDFLADDIIENWLYAPLTADEITAIRTRQINPFADDDPMHEVWQPLDPAKWLLPQDRVLPPSYRDFLRWSNGGTFVTGEREFQMLKAEELREYTFLYDVPESLPGCIPFALNGGGCLYLFDLREPPDSTGEYPILFGECGRLSFDDAPKLAHSLIESFRGRTNPEDLLFP